MPIRVYIDQGHNPSGYPNAGAEGNGYTEQDIVYEIGRLLYRRLAADPNFQVRMSRPTPDTVIGYSNNSSLTGRVSAANNWPADLFLSLHTNASENPQATGTEALVFSGTIRAAKIAQELLAEVVCATGLRNRGVKVRPELYVLKKTKMPAVLMELGFITNASDASLMANNPGLFADALYRGLRNYYGV